MEAQIRISGGDEVEEFTDLGEWLRRERGLAVRSVARPPGETELGGAFDMLAVALGSGGAGAVLARSLTTWLSTRRANIKIKVTTENGTVDLEAENLDRSDALPLLMRVLPGDDG